jgi:hypothetical protein
VVMLVAVGAAMGACGSDGDRSSPATTTVAVPATGAAEQVEVGTPASEVDAAPSAAPPAPEATLDLAAPKGAYPVVWVRTGERVEMRTEPGGGKLVKRIGRRTEFGSPSVFGVIEERDGWAGVSTPLLPNGRLGWIELEPKTVEAGWTKHSIEVDLSARTAALLRGDERRLSFPVTVGAPGSDTPTGRFAVTDTFTKLNSAAYGCCALAISATQPNLPSGWLGGERIAIHGTSGPLGIAASHGCIRAADPDVLQLVRTVALGTPVFVRG